MMYRISCRPRNVNPFQAWTELEESMNALFSRSGRRANEPAFNLFADENGAVLTAELPGIDVEALDIQVEGDGLTVKGEFPDPAPGDGGTMIRQERWGGSFSRALRLPFRVDGDGVKATYERGILTIELPKAEEERARRIEIKNS